MGKNKLRKFEEMRNFPNVVQPEINDYPSEDFYLKGKWSKDFFKNNNPLVLELGCGKGEYSVALAKKYPNKNFIGIDIKGARMWTGAKQALELGLKNVAFLRTKIDFITYFFHNEVQEIWIPFPDPQPKKPKKRLTSPKFLNLYRQIIDNEAIVHLKTDNKYLFDYTLEVLEKNNQKPIFACDDIYNSSDVPSEVKDIQTYYEKQFLQEGKKITYLKFRLSKNFYWEDIPKKPEGSPYK